MQDLVERAHSGDPDAQFELGRQYAARQEFARARRLLRSAAERGHPGALTELGLFTLFGIGMDPEVGPAMDLLRRAEQAGSAEASYQLALSGWCDDPHRFDPATIGERLLRAARGGFPAALRALALVYATDTDAPERGRAQSDACLLAAAARGDGVSALLLGRRRLLAGDVAGARPLLALALARGATRAGHWLGEPEAGVPFAELDATLPLLEPVALRAPALEPATVHCSDPLVATHDNALSAEECEYVIALGDAFLSKSVVMNDVTAATTINEHRTSSDHSFYTFQDDFGLRWLQWRLVVPLAVPLQNCEPLVLLRYGPGEEYRPHRDYLPPSGPGMGRRPDQPGQRIHTTFCYLADVEDGGETEFPLLGIRVAPRAGRVVHFRNASDRAEPDPRTLHAGLPVRSGTKWLATLWTRERRYRSY
jgi:hypothetical protein